MGSIVSSCACSKSSAGCSSSCIGSGSVSGGGIGEEGKFGTAGDENVSWAACGSDSANVGSSMSSGNGKMPVSPRPSVAASEPARRKIGLVSSSSLIKPVSENWYQIIRLLEAHFKIML